MTKTPPFGTDSSSLKIAATQYNSRDFLDDTCAVRHKQQQAALVLGLACCEHLWMIIKGSLQLAEPANIHNTHGVSDMKFDWVCVGQGHLLFCRCAF